MNLFRRIIMAIKEETLEREGVKFRVIPVSSLAIMDASRSIPEPKIPAVKVPSTSDPLVMVEVENPSDPAYLRALDNRDQLRAQAMIDVYAVLGIELLSELNPQGPWRKRVDMLAKRHVLDLTSFDMADLLDVEFVFRRYILATPDVQQKISELSGISPQNVKVAEDTFPS
jgi:hypothetical protein